MLIKTQKEQEMAKNNFEEINFQHYVAAVKQKKIDWNIFIESIQDLSYSDRNRLRILNAILLTELTVNYSDLDKFKCDIIERIQKSYSERGYYLGNDSNGRI